MVSVITPRQALDVLNYLFAANAITVTDHQDHVWADYLNAPETGLPGLQTGELLPAARRAIKDWADGGRAWRISVEHYAHALRQARRDRLEHDRLENGALTPEGIDTGADHRKWMQAATHNIMLGRSRAHAVRAAYEAVGVAPPPALPTVDRAASVAAALRAITKTH